MPQDMAFSRLHDPKSPGCKCIDRNAIEDTNTVFCRRVWDKTSCDGDFLSWWEMGKRPKCTPDDPVYCITVCGFKGVSIRLYATHAELVEHLRTTKRFKPNPNAPPSPRYYCKVRFALGAGKVRPSPSKGDPSHYDFYKSDSFSAVAHVHVLEYGAIDEAVGGA